VPPTIYARRHAELKQRYLSNRDSKTPTFQTQHNALFLLLGTKRLSRHGVILCGKWITEMQDAWTAPDQREMIDQLRERQERAWRRWEKRIADIEAAKAAGSTGRNKNGKKDQSTAPSTAPTVDPWEL
jgi:hypothetical protein